MPRILIVYGTTTGQTAKIADRLKEMFRAHAAEAEVYHAAGVPPEVNPRAYDAVVVLASVHAGGHQRAVRRWVKRHVAELNTRPGAFLSVCLGVLEDKSAARAEVRRIIRRFLERTGWKATEARPVAGALPWSKYHWFIKLIMRGIVARAGGDTDTSRDYEYTDWADLDAFAAQFTARAGGADPARQAPGVPAGAFSA